jgi:hypothetical protein
MSLKDWSCDHDKFELHDVLGGPFEMSFPCCVCKHRFKVDTEEPCRSCGHNMNAVLRDD